MFEQFTHNHVMSHNACWTHSRISFVILLQTVNCSRFLFHVIILLDCHHVFVQVSLVPIATHPIELFPGHQQSKGCEMLPLLENFLVEQPNLFLVGLISAATVNKTSVMPTRNNNPAIGVEGDCGVGLSAGGLKSDMFFDASLG